MYAKKSIERAQARYFHISNDFDREAGMQKMIINLCGYNDPDYNWINEHNERQHELVRYLDRLRSQAYAELAALKQLPWYKRIFLA